MGPSIVIDGEAHLAQGPYRRVGESFNGAVDRHRRRVGRTDAGGRHIDASMGPSIVIDGEIRPQSGCTCDRQLQWGRRSSSTESRRHPHARRSCEEAASMGPSIVIDGEPRHRARDGGLDRASMGPSIVIDGESATPGTVDQLRDGLQWGRRSSSTESRRSAAGCRRPQKASMGPSIVIDGETLE